MLSKGLRLMANNAVGFLALFIALGGVGYAATGGFTSGGTLRACANEEGRLKLLKSGERCKRGTKSVSWSQTGPAGARGALGAAGAPGAAGGQGAQGGQGPQGTALAYAHVTKDATLDTANSSGVVDVKRNSSFNTGYYCLYGNFTPHVASANLDYDETSGNEHVTAIGFSSAGLDGCPASATGAPARINVLVHNSTPTLANAGFYILVN
jgi:hypothetical protein